MENFINIKLNKDILKARTLPFPSRASDLDDTYVIVVKTPPEQNLYNWGLDFINIGDILKITSAYPVIFYFEHPKEGNSHFYWEKMWNPERYLRLLRENSITMKCDEECI